MPDLAKLDAEELRAIVAKAAESHEDVARAVRLAAERDSGGLTQLRAEIDGGLRTRQFLGYHESGEWALQAEPILEGIREAVQTAPSAELVALIERAISHVVKTILHADDSNGLIGGLAHDLLDLHAEACDAGVADPLKLARWMVRFRFDDQDFFEADPVRYATALGEVGIAAYRREVDQRRQSGDGSFAAKYAAERLAILDGDTDTIIRLLGGDLTRPYQFIRVAEAMEELGRDDDVLTWATRGIAETTGWQVAQLYDLAAAVHTRCGESKEVLALRKDQHIAMPSSSTYNLLRSAAEATGAWGSERPAARSVLERENLGGLIDVLLSDGEPETAWQVTVQHPDLDAGEQRWMRLAEAREAIEPGEALSVYLRLADVQLETTGRSAYQRAVVILKKASRAATAANRQAEFDVHMADLRERHRRRPTLISLLDNAKLG